MNKLKLNPDKTEFLLIGNERRQSKYLSMFPIELFNQSINQLNFYSANIPGVARLSGTTARLVFKYKVVEVVP